MTEKKIFLLESVVDDLIDTNKSLFSPLFKLNYFARLVKNQELIEYTDQETQGYNNRHKVPSYRKTIGILYVDLQVHIHRHDHKQLPLGFLEEKYRELFGQVYIKEGIASIEKHSKDILTGDSSVEMYRPFPMELLYILQQPARKLYKSDARVTVVGAKIGFSPSVIIEIPNAIRTKLLDFVMGLADKFGYDIEIASFNKKPEINNQIIINQMNTTINNSGDGNVINTGNDNQIENNVTLYKGDIGRLQKELTQQGIEEADIQEISGIVATEEPNKETGRLGEKANGWISKIINKSLNGIGKIATGVSASLLATFIKQYYGIG